MPNKKCIQCTRDFQIRKNNINSDICGICNCKNKRLEIQLDNLNNKKLKRNCPTCNCEIIYKNERRYNKALLENCNCKNCTAIQQFKNLDKDIKAGKRKNGFADKKHTDDVKYRLSLVDKSYMSKLDYSWVKSGKESSMYGRSLYSIWIEKYGKEVADHKLIDFKAKISKATSGKNNPMYGKPSPQGTGNGWKGWYNGIFFRSILELSFLVNYVDRFKMKMESGEKAKYAIQYKDYRGVDRTYFPDYIINNKYMVEVKPKKLINSPSIKAKTNAAIKWCNINKLKYKILEPFKIDKQILINLYNNKEVVFSKKYEDRFINYLKI